MANKTKKLLALFLSLLMIFSTTSVAFAADGDEISVEIISFMRGKQDDLRSSELLEARVSGYDGNVRELTYKWTTTLGTYLYVYNSHNMYYIRNTPGEVEVYNSKKLLPTPDMTDRYYPNEFTGTGYAWAAVHSVSQYDKSQLVGEVTVTVYDKNGKELCSDKHEGILESNQNKGFLFYDLEQDLDNVVIGMFEGDKRNVKDLLGESAVVHIVCIASTVMAGKITSGDEYIDLTKESDGDYYITAEKAGSNTTAAGDAIVDLTVQKNACKFHRGTSGNAETTVFVFKKPTTRTTTTTLTLSNIDPRCEYFINGVQGTKQEDGTVIFTGLDPNTNYPVEVRAKFEDSYGNERYAYAFVYDTTKPMYKATVQTYLDDVLTDIADIHGEDVTLYLHEDVEGAEYIALNYESPGVYTAEVNNGIYFPWHIEAGDHYHKAKEFKLVIENANGQLDLHHYSVNYNANGGTFTDGKDAIKEIYPSASSVKATDKVPVREGYVFAGWTIGDATYAAGDEITSRIAAPVTLIAKWEKQVNVTINVTIDHRYDDGEGNKGYDHNENKDELFVEFLEMAQGSPAFVETGDKINFSADGVTDGKGNSKDFTCTTEKATDGETVLVTKYTANTPTYTDLLETSTFGVAVSKSGYDVGVIEKTVDENGNWTINIPLTYNPDDFDINFSVEMEEGTPKELYPDAVIVKIACWDEAANKWIIISQQRTTDLTTRPGVRVDIDPNTGKGAGSYPVWKHMADNSPYGYRAVVTGFIYKDSTIIIPSESIKEENNAVIAYTDGNYTATMGDISDGKLFSKTLYGAYYSDSTKAQAGTLHGVISVEKYNVTFDANGGAVNGKDKDVAEQKYRVPSFAGYQPVMEDHNFLGWYTDENCTVPATEGELLTKDITLYAKWDKILTGTLIVDGYYTDESGTQHKVDDVDRATHALVELEEIFDGHTYDIAGQTVEIKWTDGEHTSIAVPYEFKGLDPDKTYRINVYLMNYEAAYQNSTTEINGNGDIHDDYNEDDYTAVYTAESKYETFVNTFLHFEPEEETLNVVVDSSRIGGDFRYKDALVKYYSEEVGVDDNYVLITQHTGENGGVQVKMNADGFTDGNYGDKVWKKNYNGNLYAYQASLVTLDGKDIADLPVDVIYGEDVRWSPYQQAFTDTLKIELHPKRYKIIYHWNDGTDNTLLDGRGHIWSYSTDITNTMVLEREGYTFLGWYANPECTGATVKVIPAEVADDINVYAKWEKRTDLELTVKYVDASTGTLLETVEKKNLTYGDEYTAESLKKEFTGFTYKDASAESVTITTGDNEITLYYARNSYKYTVNYLEEGREDIAVWPSKTGEALYGETVTENAIEIKGWTLTSADKQSIVIDKENIVINFYYADDTLGGGENGDQSDGIPDKYQKKIIYKVVNGTWSDGSIEDIIQYVTLIEDGKYSPNGKAEITPPTGMIPAEGYKDGSWNKDTSKPVSGTTEETFIFTFVEAGPEEEEPKPEPDPNPEDPADPDVPGGEGGNGDSGDGTGTGGEAKNYIVFGKTDGIGWYSVSKDGGATFETVYGNSTYEVEKGTQIIVKACDIMGDSFTFYVNGNAIKPDENGNLVITVDGYMLIGAIGIDPDIDFEVPDAEESLNWFQRIIKAIKDFFAKLFGKK